MNNLLLQTMKNDKLSLDLPDPGEDIEQPTALKILCKKNNCKSLQTKNNKHEQAAKIIR